MGIISLRVKGMLELSSEKGEKNWRKILYCKKE
jgi:hypothetical protein